MVLLVNQLNGFGIITFAKESRAIIDAMTVAPNIARARLVDLTVRAFLGAALWPLIDVAWFMGAHDEQAAGLNWKDPSSFALIPMNTPVFTADRGWATTQSGLFSWVDTGWDWGNNGANYTQNNAAASVYQLTAAGQNQKYVAGYASGSYRTGIGGQNGTGRGAQINSVTTISPSAGGSFPQMISGRRNTSTDSDVIINGVQAATGAATSTAGNSTLDFGIGRFGGNYQNGLASFLAFHAYFDDAQFLSFYNIVRAYLRGIGAVT